MALHCHATACFDAVSGGITFRFEMGNPYDLTDYPPPDVPRERLEKNLDEASKNTRGIFYLYLGSLAFCLLTVVGTSDRQLLLGESIQLPFVRIPVPLYGFFLTAPLFLILVFVYFQLYLQRIKSLKLELKKLGGLEQLSVYPWMINIAEDPDPGFIGWTQKFVISCILWGALPVLLAIFYVWVLKRHEPFLSWTLYLEYSFGTCMVLAFWSVYQSRSWVHQLRFFFFLVLLLFGSQHLKKPFWAPNYLGKVGLNNFDPRYLNLSFQN